MGFNSAFKGLKVNPTPLHTGFVADKEVTLTRFWALQFSLVSIIPPILRTLSLTHHRRCIISPNDVQFKYETLKNNSYGRNAAFYVVTRSQCNSDAMLHFLGARWPLLLSRLSAETLSATTSGARCFPTGTTGIRLMWRDSEMLNGELWQLTAIVSIGQNNCLGPLAQPCGDMTAVALHWHWRRENWLVESKCCYTFKAKGWPEVKIQSVPRSKHSPSLL